MASRIPWRRAAGGRPGSRGTGSAPWGVSVDSTETLSLADVVLPRASLPMRRVVCLSRLVRPRLLHRCDRGTNLWRDGLFVAHLAFRTARAKRRLRSRSRTAERSIRERTRTFLSSARAPWSHPYPPRLSARRAAISESCRYDPRLSFSVRKRWTSAPPPATNPVIGSPPWPAPWR